MILEHGVGLLVVQPLAVHLKLAELLDRGLVSVVVVLGDAVDAVLASRIIGQVSARWRSERAECLRARALLHATGGGVVHTSHVRVAHIVDIVQAGQRV